MENKVFTCEQARKIDLVDYLFTLGFQPKKIRGHDYWYLSPLREEKEASFKVNRRLNVWYDFGIGSGGDIIDFGVLYNHSTIAELLQRLKQNHFSFHPHSVQSQKSFHAGEKGKIKVVDEREIVSQKLIEYLSEIRKISLDTARQFCKEIDFVLYDKKNTAIGFKNSAGGYELPLDIWKTFILDDDLFDINISFCFRQTVYRKLDNRKRKTIRKSSISECMGVFVST